MDTTSNNTVVNNNISSQSVNLLVSSQDISPTSNSTIKDNILVSNDTNIYLYLLTGNADLNDLIENNNMTAENIQSQYLEYNLQASINDTVYDNCNFANYNTATATYITSAKDAYSTSRFARNDVVCTYIMENEKTQQAEPSYTK